MRRSVCLHVVLCRGEKLTRIVDHCHSPYCQFTIPLDNWKQRSLHITRHCDLKAAAGLIHTLNNRGLIPGDHFQALFTRNGTLNSLQQTLISFYGPYYSLESLRLPWTPEEEDWQPVKTFLEERLSRIPLNQAGEGRHCTLCKGWEREKCPFCRLRMRRRERRRVVA